MKFFETKNVKIHVHRSKFYVLVDRLLTFQDVSSRECSRMHNDTPNDTPDDLSLLLQVVVRMLYVFSSE